ncbi:Ran GTPase binding protein [Reticulomyxa filosa]|uniref:Ran GTPase binding protein n=1 Tax=Reticulomyxa filosa TaxID=46433 RepID=X6M7Z0_RETFI|nr:Ran GTPase binding protein [Reticulomyxa filosa]|eukprot:ETO09572.1 Ran GTPase binding protein [Reticulomyxa filosa]
MFRFDEWNSQGFANFTSNEGDTGFSSAQDWGHFDDSTDPFNVKNFVQSNDGEQDEEWDFDPKKQVDNGGVEGDDENCCECTVQPLVELEEKSVPTGTDNETKTHHFHVTQLYRWGKNVTQQFEWKNRAKDTSIEFWQDNKTGKIRIICRENLTGKLRMNQFVSNSPNVKELSPQSCKWGPCVDDSIAQEENNQGVSLWAVKFAAPELCKQFQSALSEAAEKNKQAQEAK